MAEPNIVCIDRQFYENAYPDTGFEEARAILIGMYLEKELEPAKQQQLKVHLEKCACCTQFLGELEKIGEFKSVKDPVPYAACPSSEEMDIFIFDRPALASQRAEAIEAHVKECPLCKEEIDWLRGVERGKVLEYRNVKPPATFFKKDAFSQIAAIAAVFFFALSAFFWWQTPRSNLPTKQLKALAHVKEPNEINFANLAQTAPALDPENQRRYDEGLTFFKEGNFRDAGARFEDVLIKKPDHSASLFLLGYCYYKLDQMEKAFALCNRAESMHPHSLERCMSLVNMALMTGHYDRAIEEINALYHAAPQVAEVNQMYHKIMNLTHGHTVKL